jgi:hypothetical protein
MIEKKTHFLPVETEHQLFIPIILATWKAEMERIIFGGNAGPPIGGREEFIIFHLNQ